MAKPLIFPENYDIKKFDPNNRGIVDPSRIGGYDKQVMANDLDKADVYEFHKAHESGKKIRTKEDAFRAIGAHPKPLPVEFKWLRVSGPGGAYSASATAEVDVYSADQGFIPCTKERFDNVAKEYGYTLESNAWVAEDGTIRRGYDVALFYRSGDVARAWEKALAAETAKREGESFPERLRDAETFREETKEEIFLTH